MSEWIHTASRQLPAPPAAVFLAWTDAARLERWFAEHVAIDVRPGGAYQFWGRHTYGVPDRARATQRLLRVEHDTTLAFDWNWAGSPSAVTIILRSALSASSGAGQTALTLEHRFVNPPPGNRATELVDDWWRMSLGNLDAFLRGGDGLLRPDFSDPKPRVELSIVLDAPRERVFAALMDPQTMNQWIATSARVEPRVGGVYSFGWTYEVGDRRVAGGPTRILELVPNERLVIDWPDWRGDASEPPTTVTWLLESVGDKTRLTLIHGGFARVADLSDYPHGWRAFLDKLRAFVWQGVR